VTASSHSNRGLVLEILIGRRWPERKVPGITGFLKDLGNYATSARPTGIPREKLRLPRREVPPGCTATDNLAYRLSFIVYRLVYRFVYRFRLSIALRCIVVTELNISLALCRLLLYLDCKVGNSVSVTVTVLPLLYLLMS